MPDTSKSWFATPMGWITVSIITVITLILVYTHQANTFALFPLAILVAAPLVATVKEKGQQRNSPRR